METTNQQSNTQTHQRNDYILFQTVGCGSIRLGKHLATKQRLENLCQVKDMILINDEGMEIDPTPEGTYELDSSHTYTVAEEENLQDDDENMTREQFMQKRMTFINKCRARLPKMQEARIKLIQELYKPKHQHVYKFDESYLVPSFVDAVKKGTPESLMSILKKETTVTPLYSFDMLSPKFCKDFQEEIENFESTGLPLMRPNTMNNYGVVLDEIGFEDMITELRQKYLDPYCKLLFADVGSHIDAHHSFIVEYQIGKDTDLDFHYDESEVTLNVCLGKEFTGGALYFKGLLNDPNTHNEMFVFNHKPGMALLHYGKHRHGASKITSGHRSNLIIWMRDNELRRKKMQEQMEAMQRGECTCGHDHGHEDEEEEEEMEEEHEHGEHCDHDHSHHHHDHDDHCDHDHDNDHDHSHHHHGHSHGHSHSHSHGHGHSH